MSPSSCERRMRCARLREATGLEGVRGLATFAAAGGVELEFTADDGLAGWREGGRNLAKVGWRQTRVNEIGYNRRNVGRATTGLPSPPICSTVAIRTPLRGS